MYYLNSEHLNTIGRNWKDLAKIIEKAVICLGEQEFSQPIKPYLRYRDKANRIIAMPAFIGGDINFSGIKWIASFPKNYQKGLKRAHSVSILNEADSGVPVCTINTTLISGIRTAAVTGLMITKYLELKPHLKDLVVGMTGFGPIGQFHLEMAASILGDRLKEFRIYDLRPIDEKLIPAALRDKVVFSKSYTEAFDDVDMFMTATVSSKPYINIKPKPGSIHLNVSLRDYESDFMKYVDVMVVDDWNEICREKTDIEMMHLNNGLQEEDTINLVDIFCHEAMDQLKEDDVVMFNPMGMAVFDVAVSSYYYRLSKEKNVGVLLAD